MEKFRLQTAFLAFFQKFLFHGFVLVVDREHILRGFDTCLLEQLNYLSFVVFMSGFYIFCFLHSIFSIESSKCLFMISYNIVTFVAFKCVWYIVVSWSSRIISALLSSRQDGAFHSQIVSLTLQYWSCEGEAPTTPQTPNTRRKFKMPNSNPASGQSTNCVVKISI